LKEWILFTLAFTLVLCASPNIATAQNSGGPVVSPQSPEPIRRAELKRLLASARGSLAQGDTVGAKRTAQIAEALRVQPDPVTAPFEDSVAKLRADIARAESRGPAPPITPTNGGAFNPGAPPNIAAAPRPSQGPRMFPSTDGSPNMRPVQGPQAGGPFNPNAGAPSLPPELAARRDQALRMSAQARLAMDQGDYQSADRLIKQALSLNVPDEAFGPGAMHPQLLSIQIDREVARRSVIQAGYDQGGPSRVAQGVYRPNNDPTRVVPAGNFDGPTTGPGGEPPSNTAMKALNAGMEAQEQGDNDAALKHFTEAWKSRQELDPYSLQALQEKLAVLQAVASSQRVREGAPNPLVRAVTEQEVKRQQLFRKIGQERAAAEKMREKRPKDALARMQALRQEIVDAKLEPAEEKNMMFAVDRTIRELETYITRNSAQIATDERNAAITAEVEADRMHDLERQNKLADLVETFNSLMREERYSEAVIVAKQARELDPGAAVVENMVFKSTFAYRIASQMAIRNANEENFFLTMQSVEASSVPFDDRNPYQMGDRRTWEALSAKRLNALKREQTRYNPAELNIQRTLANPVDVHFNNRPLGEVMAALGDIAQVNIYLDPEGLAAEGVNSATAVNIDLRQPVSLQSALKLILEPLNLSFVIQNEVLRITSEQTRKTDVYPLVYYVADLVVPIPNFTPSYNMGVPAAMQHAYEMAGYGGSKGLGLSGNNMPLTVANNDSPASTSASVLAQMNASGLSYRGQSTQSTGSGPGGLGGGSAADFDSLIDLITSTIAPESWDEVGGPGSLSGFDTNLSLVVSQTQEIHEQIADLLEQLRRLQDLQVTIEVRFITLNDNFFERIGIDFEFDIDDNTRLGVGDLIGLDDDSPSVSFGLDAAGAPTLDLDVSFTQDSFTSSVPQFGGFDPATAANVGFAILSDIEVFFLLQAAQGDTRSNVMQAPKVTLFNGQQAFISDTSQTPFVTSVVPVVGDFAAAHQPVVMVLSEGMSLSVQAVVSNDKRFVRLTLVPFFSSIGDVQEFTFDGKTTQSTGEAVLNDKGKIIARDGATITTEGTTVQLPQFTFTTVTTTVSVPDGGTVLMGGIKRLSEGRNENGVPLLSKVPYVNRLFKNVGIGRTTQSLMMMVTPRIIIQEEEEERTVGRPLTSQAPFGGGTVR